LLVNCATHRFLFVRSDHRLDHHQLRVNGLMSAMPQKAAERGSAAMGQKPPYD
jgi:hypothetical protein